MLCLLAAAAGFAYSINLPVIDLDVFSRRSFGYGYLLEKGSPVKASKGGRVIALSNDPANSTNLGRYVILEHRMDRYFLPPVYTVYASLLSIAVEKDDFVEGGCLIGYAGGESPLREVRGESTMFFGLFVQPSDMNEYIPLYGQATYAHNFVWFDPFYKPEENNTSFNYNSYFYIDWVDLDIMTEHALQSGSEPFGHFRKISTRLPLYKEVNPLDEKVHKEAALVFRNGIIPAEYESIYNHYFVHKSNNIEYVYLVQDNLIPYLEKLKPDTSVLELFFVEGAFYPAQNRVYSFVNEFAERNRL